MSASPWAVRRWGRSPPGSPRSSGCRRRRTRPSTTAISPPSPAAWPWWSAGRAGIEKPPPRRSPNVPVMDITLSATFVTVSDFEAALAFYRDALGFEVKNDVGQGAWRWITLASPASPEVEIVLNPTHAGREADGDAVAALRAKGSLNGLLFKTEDVDASFEKVRATGAEVLQEPMDMPYGVRDCAFRDPSGNMVRIQSAKRN